MFEKIQNLLGTRGRKLADSRNLTLYIFLLVVLAISWSSAKTIQRNYELQKEVAMLEEENELLKLYNENKSLENQYLETDQFLELSARQNLGLAAPGEKVLLVPASAAARHIDKSLMPGPKTDTRTSGDDKPAYLRNLQAWRDFLLGRES